MPTVSNNCAPLAATSTASLVEVTLDRWQTFVDAHPRRTALHHRNWIELLADHYRLTYRGFGLERDGILTAAAPFLATPTLFGRKKQLASLPFSDCVPVLAADATARDELIRILAAAGPLDSYSQVSIRTDEKHPSISAPSALYRHLVRTDVPLESARAGMDRRTRQNIRRAQGAGLRFETTTDASVVNAFHALQVETRKKHGVPAQSRRFFRQLQRHMVDAGLGFWGLVRLGDEIAAAGLLLDFGETLICKYCASNSRLLHLRPNDLFFAEVIGWAVRGSPVALDLGSAREQDEGLRRFKRQLGARETPLHYLLLKGRATARLGDGRWGALGGSIIRRGPRFVAQAVGQFLYRYSQ